MSFIFQYTCWVRHVLTFAITTLLRRRKLQWSWRCCWVLGACNPGRLPMKCGVVVSSRSCVSLIDLLIIVSFFYITLLFILLLCYHYMYRTWFWHTYSYAFGFLKKNESDNSRARRTKIPTFTLDLAKARFYLATSTIWCSNFYE